MEVGPDVDDGRAVHGVNPSQPQLSSLPAEEPGRVDGDRVGPQGASGGEDPAAGIFPVAPGMDFQSVSRREVEPAEDDEELVLVNAVESLSVALVDLDDDLRPCIPPLVRGR